MRGFIVALDNLSLDSMLNLVKELKNKVIYKLNSAFTLHGWALVDVIHYYGGEVFLDLKFHDIPATVAEYMKIVAEKEVLMCNVHCSGGAEMMKVASETLKACAEKRRKPILLGVTVLTSLDNKLLCNVGVEQNIQSDNTGVLVDVTVEAQVKRLAELAKNSGLDGVVCSPQEIEIVKKCCGDHFLTVTPGVRPLWCENNDQKRVMTPEEAIKMGADYLVVGRPITQAEKYGMNSLEAVNKILL